MSDSVLLFCVLVCCSSKRFRDSIVTNTSLIDRVLFTHRSSFHCDLRQEIRSFLSFVTRNHPSLTDHLRNKIISVNLSSSSSTINADLLLLSSLIQRTHQDDREHCWNSKVRTLLRLFLHSLLEHSPPSSIVFPSLLRMFLHLCKYSSLVDSK